MPQTNGSPHIDNACNFCSEIAIYSLLSRVYLNSFDKNVGQQGNYLPARFCENSTDKSSSDENCWFCSTDDEENYTRNVRNDSKASYNKWVFRSMMPITSKQLSPKCAEYKADLFKLTNLSGEFVQTKSISAVKFRLSGINTRKLFTGFGLSVCGKLCLSSRVRSSVNVLLFSFVWLFLSLISIVCGSRVHSLCKRVSLVPTLFLFDTYWPLPWLK